MQQRCCANIRLLRVGAFSPSHIKLRQHRAASTVASKDASLHQSPPSITQHQRQSRIQRQEATAWPSLDLPRLHSQTPGVRVRQHLNPFTPTLQVPIPPLNWDSIYKHAGRPLAIDIGCGPGRFPLALATKLPAYNVLGIDIRGKLLDRATAWAKLVGCADSVHFHVANATVSLYSMLSSYPGPIDLINIQFPDPHWKMRNRKKRIVQPQLVEAVAKLLAAGGRVFLQSDVQEVAVSMRDDFEYYGKGAFSIAPEHSQQDAGFYTDQMTVAPLSRDSLDRQAWKPTWQESGWLLHNPLGVPTEREVHTIDNSSPVYRVLLTATQ